MAMTSDLSGGVRKKVATTTNPTQSVYQDLVKKHGNIGVNSAYRSPRKNYLVGGAKRSQHVKAKAIDLATRNMAPAKRDAVLRDLARDPRVGGVGLYPSGNIHFDTRPRSKNGGPAIWGSNYRRSSAPASLRKAAGLPTQRISENPSGPISLYKEPKSTPVKQKRTIVVPEAERTEQQKADVAMGRPAPTKTIEVDVEQQAAIDTGNRIQTQLPRQQRGGLFGGFAKVPGVEGAGTTTASQIASSLGSSARNRSNVMNIFGAPHRNNKTLGEIDV